MLDAGQLTDMDAKGQLLQACPCVLVVVAWWRLVQEYNETWPNHSKPYGPCAPNNFQGVHLDDTKNAGMIIVQILY
jgi:hypothetical protein